MIMVMLSNIIALTVIILFLIVIGVVFTACKYINYKNRNKFKGFILFIDEYNPINTFKAKSFKSKSEIKKFLKKGLTYGSQYTPHLIIKKFNHYYDYDIKGKNYNEIISIIDEIK